MGVEFDSEKAQREKDEADAHNRQMALMGSIGDNLGSRQSFGNFFLGKMNPQSTSGRDLASSLKTDVEDPTERYAKTLSSYRLAQQAKMGDSEMKRDEEMDDPNSPNTLQAIDDANRAFPGIGLTPGRITARQLQERLPILSKPFLQKQENENWKTKENYKFGLDKALLGAKANAENGGRSPEQVKLSKLNSGDKGRLDSASMAMKAVLGMREALNAGQSTFKIMGDNDFTKWRTNFEEGIGRMQSGGAIQEGEAKRFRGMAPTWKDSPEMQASKLADLEEEMNSRLGTLGFTGEELGIKTPVVSAEGMGGASLVNEANAGQSGPTDKDVAALKWAKQNLGDPRSEKIMGGLKARGILK